MERHRLFTHQLHDDAPAAGWEESPHIRPLIRNGDTECQFSVIPGNYIGGGVMFIISPRAFKDITEDNVSNFLVPAN